MAREIAGASPRRLRRSSSDRPRRALETSVGAVVAAKGTCFHLRVENDSTQEAGPGFGRAPLEDLSDQLNPWCEAHLGSTVAGVLFTVRRLGTVIGIALADGRRVALKVSGTEEPIDRRRAAQRVRSYLFREGFPCPRPVLGPTAFGSRLAVCEELVEAGAAPNAHDAKTRRAMAEGLAWQMQITSTMKPPKELERTRPSWIDLRTSGLWPPAHHPKLDFEATEPTVGWIDQIAARAKRAFLEGDQSRSGIAHSDWEAHNVRCSGERLEVAYDWDSLAVESELALIGRAAAVFTAHTDPRYGHAPSADERLAFVVEFEQAAGRHFTAAERTVIAAVGAWATAYEARLAHAFEAAPVDRPGSFAEALREIEHEIANVGRGQAAR